MEIVSKLVLMLALGLSCAYLADKRGRSALGWFFIGCALSIVALVLLFVLPDLTARETRERALDTDLRRLRERAAKDRQVADGRYADTFRRLDVHDRALGLDTESPAALATGTVATLADPRDALARAEWYYASGSPPAPVGPISFEELVRLARASEIEGRTLVWSEPIVEWRPASAVPGLEVSRRA